MSTQPDVAQSSIIKWNRDDKKVEVIELNMSKNHDPFQQSCIPMFPVANRFTLTGDEGLILQLLDAWIFSVECILAVHLNCMNMATCYGVLPIVTLSTFLGKSCCQW